MVQLVAEVAAANGETQWRSRFEGSIVPIQHLLNPTNSPQSITSGPQTQQQVLVEGTS